MSPRRFFVFPFAILALAAACSSAPPPKAPSEVVKTRASVDFDCPETDIKTTTLDPRTRLARGCGQQATYVETCEACIDQAAQVFAHINKVDRCNCTWVMDSHRSARGAKEAPKD
jgi:hypothetical protein